MAEWSLDFPGGRVDKAAMCALVLQSVIIGVVIFSLTWQFWGLAAAIGGLYTFCACFVGMFFSLVLFQRSKKQSLNAQVYAYLAGTVVRVAVPVLFLLYSMKIWKYPLANPFFGGIIYSYFAYYPSLLVVTIRQMLLLCAGNPPTKSGTEKAVVLPSEPCVASGPSGTSEPLDLPSKLPSNPDSEAVRDSVTDQVTG